MKNSVNQRKRHRIRSAPPAPDSIHGPQCQIMTPRVNSWRSQIMTKSIHGTQCQIMTQRVKSWRSQIMTPRIKSFIKENHMKDNQLVTLSKSFAVEIIRLNDSIKANGKSNAVISQLLRSGTSIGANIHEANYAASRADFINKLQIALKECYETDYWLDIFRQSEIISESEYKNMFAECSKLRKLLSASITTAKNNKA